MMSLAIVPGVAVGPFSLGMPLNAAIEHLETQYGRIKDINLLYSDEDPLGVDIVVDLTQDGVQLRFDPASQRLQLIDVYDPSKLLLTYNDGVFSTPQEIATFQQTYNEFGPSRGKYDTVHKKYQLSYPGLVLCFAIDERHDPLFAKGAVDLTVDPSLDGYHPCLSNICVFGAGSLEKAEPPSIADTLAHYPIIPHYMERVIILPGEGLHFTGQAVKILFGDTCQDVITKIGPPSDQYYKTSDKMRIHAAQHTANGVQAAPAADFFYNYFHLGVDLLFDAHSCRVKKFVLHTNFPGHFDFHRFNRCNFYVALPESPFRTAHPTGNGHIADGPHPQTATAAVTTAPTSANGGTSSSSSSSSASASASASGSVASAPTSKSAKKAKNKADAAAAAAATATATATANRNTASPSAGLLAEAVRSPSDDLAGLLLPSVVSQQPTAMLSTGTESASASSSADMHEVLLDSRPNAASPALLLHMHAGAGAGNGVPPPGTFAITPMTKWSDVQRELGSQCGKPVAFNRAPAANSSNPFGATLFWGLQDMVFEVMGNMYIASVVLFQPAAAAGGGGGGAAAAAQTNLLQ
eukprot:m.129434 g.129434  ORF g.129434 m.129434 type:complete len:580 (+) comp16405_c0_seq6:379-2118(+)